MDDETIKISALLKRIEALELLIAGKDMVQQRLEQQRLLRHLWDSAGKDMMLERLEQERLGGQWDKDKNLKTAEQIVNEKTFEWKDNIQKLDETNKLYAQKCKEQVEKQKQEEKKDKECMEEHMYQQAIIKARVDARVRAQAHILEEEAKQELIKNKN